MAYQPPQPADMQFPLAGLDSSLTANRQPPMTTWDLNNVRAFPPSSDRLGGGSREGSTKLFADIAGTASNRRITGLDALTESSAITDPSLSSVFPLDETFSGFTIGDPGSLVSSGNWIFTRVITNGAFFQDLGFSIDANNNLAVDISSQNARHLLSAYLVDPAVGVTMTMRATTQVATSNALYGLVNQPSMFGPTLVDNGITNGIFAYLETMGANTVQCRISEWVGDPDPYTTRATTATLTLANTATIQDYVITLTIVADVVTATFVAANALTGPANLNETLSYTTTLTGTKRGGISNRMRSSASGSNFRVCSRIRLTQFRPPSNSVFNTIQPTAANPFDSNRYYVPPQWTAYSRDPSTGVITAFPAGTTSSAQPDHPAVDTTTDSVMSLTPGRQNADYANELYYAIWQGDDTGRRGIEFLYEDAQATEGQDMGGPIFRATKDGRNGLYIQPAALASQGGQWSLTGALASFQGIAIVDGVSTNLGSIVFSPTSGGAAVQLPIDAPQRWTDDGTNIRLYVNGVLVLAFTGASYPNWTPAIEAALAANTGVGFGCGNLNWTPALVRGDFGRVRVVQGEGSESAAASNIKNRLAIYSAGGIDIGDTEDLSVSPVAGVVLIQPRPQSASFNRKFYAVDGDRDIIVDPVTLTSVTWASEVTDGTLPADCQLISFFRGAAYLAATNSDPTIWYKSRTLDPLDWDYAADPQVSTAVAGNNGTVGQPADAITAIFGFADDYLVFGMARSVGVLEGDPNYGGQFQIKTRETGIVGPRAFCFDDRGNLYFVGAGGLYLMLRGSFDPSPVGPRKLRRQLEELDLGANFVQMEFRASDRTVRIYLTPTNATTPATCFVLDTRTEGYFSDQIPLAHGPWAIEQINGVLDLDRNLIIGGSDGFIRRPNDDALTDDGLAIPSHVEIPIPDLGSGGLLEYIVQELQFVLAEGGGRITWRWFTAPSPEQVRLQTVGQEQASGVLDGTGFKPAIGLRATGAAHKLRLESTGFAADGTTPNRWALERVTAMLAATTRRR